jgi:hypothetical protein
MKCLAYFGPLRCKCHYDDFYACILSEDHEGAHEADWKHTGANVPEHVFRWEESATNG